MPNKKFSSAERKLVEKLAENVRARRITMCMTQAALAKKCGCSTMVICHVERADNFPSLPIYIAICEALGMGKAPLL